MNGVSVIICAHNPRPNFLNRVLSALKTQTLPKSDWELILVDNASSEPLADRFDLLWHPAGRHVREEDLGLTPARLRGIAEAKGDVLVFVDDDNVLAETYLSNSLSIADKFPFLGAWGGSLKGEFEILPPRWALPALRLIAVHECAETTWSNDITAAGSHPCGAGLCIRRSVAIFYRDESQESGIRRFLDRRGNSLLSGGDMDLIFCSKHFGLGWGLFPQLRLVHLIPAERLTRSYFLRLCMSATQSWNMLLPLHGLLPQKPSGWLKASVRAMVIAMRQGLFAAQMDWMAEIGRRRAWSELARRQPSGRRA